MEAQLLFDALCLYSLGLLTLMQYALLEPEETGHSCMNSIR